MSLRRRTLGRFALALSVFSLATRSLAQTSSPTTVAAGTLRNTENSRVVTGVRIEPRPDGTVWFLIPLNDRIVQLQADGVTFKQWQIRDDKNLGANPVDFEIDGKIVWFLENGESLIDAGRCALGRLDTATGQLREWVIPGAKPAGLWRAPDGNTVWIPQTNGRLQSIDLTTLQVIDYRSTKTFAYSHVAYGPDGALWMTDFGNNRIVRYVPGSNSETSWTFFDPLAARLNPSQIQFDDQGRLWISQLTAGRVDRFEPTTSQLTGFVGFSFPIHFDIFNGRIYVAEQTGGNGRIAVLDPALAIGGTTQLTSETLEVKSTVSKLAATIRDTTIAPTTFTTTANKIADADLKVTSGGVGILRTEFPSGNAYGISAAGGGVWVGSNGNLVRLTLQNIGTPSDLTVPVAAEFGVSPGARIRIDITLSNRGSAAISGDALLLASPGSFAPRTTFTVNPGQTIVLTDAFKDFSSNTGLALGPARLRVTSGTATDLVASVRTARIQEDGSSFGFALPALSGAQVLGQGSSRTLFTDAREGTVSVLGLFSPAGGSASLTLVAPDGTVRGTRAVTLDPNVSIEFNPAASAFGVAASSGDVIRMTVNSGSMQPYVNVVDLGTNDVATSPPLAATDDAVLPNVGTLMGSGDTGFVSDLFLSNADPVRSAQVTVSFSAVASAAPPATAMLTLPANGSRAIAGLLGTLFGVTAGQGAIRVSSNVPLAVAARVASRSTAGDYATFVAAFDGGEAIPGGGAAFAFGVPQTDTRRTHLLLYNRGAAGTVTVIGFNGDGTEIGRLAIPVGSEQAARVNSVFAQLGVFDQSAGAIRIETTSGMQVYAQTAEVDASGDLEIARLQPAP